MLAALLVVTTLLSLVMTGRLSVYMWSTDNRSFALIPDDDFLTRHSLPLGLRRRRRALRARDPNLYEADHYRPATADHGVELGALDQDPFQYPPVILVPFAGLLEDWPATSPPCAGGGT